MNVQRQESLEGLYKPLGTSPLFHDFLPAVVKYTPMPTHVGFDWEPNGFLTRDRPTFSTTSGTSVTWFPHLKFAQLRLSRLEVL